MRISVKRLDPDLPLPRYARASDAGLDDRIEITGDQMLGRAIVDNLSVMV